MHKPQINFFYQPSARIGFNSRVSPESKQIYDTAKKYLQRQQNLYCLSYTSCNRPSSYNPQAIQQSTLKYPTIQQILDQNTCIQSKFVKTYVTDLCNKTHFIRVPESKIVKKVVLSSLKLKISPKYVKIMRGKQQLSEQYCFTTNQDEGKVELKIVLKELHEIPNVKIQQYGQTKMVQLQCGHSHSKLTMKDLLDEYLNGSCCLDPICKQTIQDQETKEMKLCRQPIDLHLCKLIAELTQEEQQQFDQNLLQRKQQFKNQSLKPQEKIQKIHIRVQKIQIDSKIQGQSPQKLPQFIDFDFYSNQTVLSVKEAIYQLFDELKPYQMSLKYKQNMKLLNEKTLGEYTSKLGTSFEVSQMKEDLIQLKHLNPQQIMDQMSCENFSVKMNCGHYIGQDDMCRILKMHCSQRKIEIRCPYQQTYRKECNGLWEWSLCKEVAILTKSQEKQLSQGLSLNYIRENAKECPNCKRYGAKGNLKTNRVRCLSCKKYDFCYECLSPWETNSQECVSEVCKNGLAGINETLRICAPITIQVGDFHDVPSFRACPKCNVLINFGGGCKHMTCKNPNCKTQFCFVCLQIKNGDRWNCGDRPSDPCNVADRQILFGKK